VPWIEESSIPFSFAIRFATGDALILSPAPFDDSRFGGAAGCSSSCFSSAFGCASSCSSTFCSSSSSAVRVFASADAPLPPDRETIVAMTSPMESVSPSCATIFRAPSASA